MASELASSLCYPIVVGTIGATWLKPGRDAHDHAFEHAAQARGVCASIELDGSFRRLPRAEEIAAWRALAPSDHRFVLTAPRALTHTKRLQGCDAELNELRRRADIFGQALAALVFHLPADPAIPAAQIHAFVERRPDNTPWLFVLPDDLPDRDTIEHIIRSSGAGYAFGHAMQLSGRATPKLAYWRITDSYANARFAQAQQIAARALAWQQQGTRSFIHFGGENAVRDASRVRHLLTTTVQD